MKVSIIHLDLGIGGAERLIVNTSIVLKELVYNVTIITSHHDKKHCFEETNTNGILSNHIIVYGDWIPRNILGKGTAFFAIIRMIYMTIILIINSIIHKIYYNDNYIDYVFIDGVSASIPPPAKHG
jgi:alpha-1,3/alpha-1,6-mannosyltransferase